MQDPDQRPRSCWRAFRETCIESQTGQAVRKFIRGRPFTIVTMLGLFLALFLGEIFVVCQVPSNTEQDVVLTIVFALFVFEWVGLTLTDANYLFGFFFLMDLLGTASMVLDISYMAGPDAMAIEEVTEGANQDNVIVVRAARAAKLGARAGRLSRAVKLLKMLPGMSTKEDASKVKIARVISNQLNTVLSTRVAFLTIITVVGLPMFQIWQYPEMDDSMGTWAELLDRNAMHFKQAANSTVALQQQIWLQSEVDRMMASYQGFSYGPFKVCYGDLSSNSVFQCRPDLLTLNYTSKFDTPDRLASIRQFSQETIQLSFNLVAPKQEESLAGMGLLCFVVLVMCVFGLLMSQSISTVALLPLERMLSVVRQRCQQIFKYTTDLKDDDESEDEDDDDQELEQSSEFMLLEKVVKKLAAIAHLSSVAGEPEVKENMTENEIMTLNWLQGASIANGRRPGLTEGDEDKSTSMMPTPRGKDLSAITAKIPANTLEELNTPDFNALSQTVELKIAIGTYVVWVHEGCVAWVRDNVPETTLFKFMTACEAKYPSENPFHNFSHGLDVLYNVSRFCRLANLQSTFTDTSQFWLLIAAAGHDLGHLGVNNQFLVETNHDVAVKYNDRSPLENMHCAMLFQVAHSSPETNVFGNVDKDTYKEMRKGIIAAILHTDMVKHNEMIKELSLLYQMNSDALDSLKPESVIKSSAGTCQTLMNALLHCADIGNPMKPWEICYELAHLCLDEFFAQGDMEKERGIPVQMLNDREKVNRPNSQVGFIEFVICPMAESITNIFPQLDHLAHHLGINVQNWLQLWIEEASPPEEQSAKVSERVRRVVLRLKMVMREERGIPVSD